MVEQEHPCKEMADAAADRRIMIRHNPTLWAYGVRILDSGYSTHDQEAEDGTGVSDKIYYCPWSGELLPDNLVESWEDIAETEFGIDWENCSGDEADLLVPPEMHSDQWWRIRGLKPRVRDPAEAEIPKPSTDPHPYKVRAINPPPGFLRSVEPPPHLCKCVAEEFSDVRVMFAYLPNVREYGFRILELDLPVDYQPIRIKSVNFCPWCGTRLPLALRREWLTRLAVLGLSEDSPDIPPHLVSDQWWRDENL